MFAMSYDLSRGVINVQGQNSQKRSKFEGREGYTVGLYMRWAETDLRGFPETVNVSVSGEFD